MVSKDQGIGGAILAVCVIVAVGYLVLAVDPGLFNLNATNARLDAVLVLVSAAFVVLPSNRRMDRLDDGNNTSSKANRRNNS